MEQNSIYPTSYNLEILITQHLRRIVKTGGFAFCQEKASSMKQADLGDMFKEVQRGLQEYLHINHCGISLPLSPASSTSSTMRSPEHTVEEPDEPEQADE